MFCSYRLSTDKLSRGPSATAEFLVFETQCSVTVSGVVSPSAVNSDSESESEMADTQTKTSSLPKNKGD